MLARLLCTILSVALAGAAATQAQVLDYRDPSSVMDASDIGGTWQVIMNWGGSQNNSVELWTIEVQGNTVGIRQNSAQLGIIPGFQDMHEKRMRIRSMFFDGRSLRLDADVIPGVPSLIEAQASGGSTLSGQWSMAASGMWGNLGPTGPFPFRMTKCPVNPRGMVECPVLY